MTLFSTAAAFFMLAAQAPTEIKKKGKTQIPSN
jgi:hypothetical protein